MLVFICEGGYNIFIDFWKGEFSKMSNAEEYIQKFKELEAVVKETFGLNDWDSVTNFLSKRDEYRPYREEIKYCQEVRNLLQHKQKIGGEYPVEPTDQMLEFLNKTVDSLKNRKKCEEIMVPISRLFYRKTEDSVFATVPRMKEIPSGHVPVLDDGKVVGVFTAVSFLNIMADKRGEPIEKNMTFEEVKEYIGFDSHDSEVYRFVKKNLYVDELKDVFEQTYSGGKRLAMVFITTNGKADGNLIGTISPWDVLGKDEN